MEFSYRQLLLLASVYVGVAIASNEENEDVLLCSLPLLTSGGCGVSDPFSDGLVPSVHQKPGNYPLSFDIIDDTGEARIKFRTACFVFAGPLFTCPMYVKIKALLVQDIGLTMELFFKLTPETSFLEDFEEKKNYFKFKFPGAEKSGEQVTTKEPQEGPILDVFRLFLYSVYNAGCNVYLSWVLFTK